MTDAPAALARPSRALSVSLGAGRQPEVATHVALDEWEGPLGLLLSLIEARQLDVLTVPLGGLAESYLDALATLDGDRMTHVSAFVAVAGQLILIKSRALLPRRAEPGPTGLPDDGPDPEAELRERLLLYRAYRDAGARLSALALEWVGLFRREPGAAGASAVAGARPADAPPLDVEVLVRALDGLARIAPPPLPPPEAVPRTLTLAERADVIRAALRDAGSVVLQELLRGVRDRVVMAVTFLAMLELVKRREIVVEQAEPWGPIVARPTTPDERAAAGAADPTTPIDESLEDFG
jgi:segregation and condensation protein A